MDQQFSDRSTPLSFFYQYGETPLSYAARRGHEEAIRCLRRWGADAFVKDRFGDDAKENAKSAKCVEALEGERRVASSVLLFLLFSWCEREQIVLL